MGRDKERIPYTAEQIAQTSPTTLKLLRLNWKYGWILDWVIVVLLILGFFEVQNYQKLCGECRDIQLVNCPYAKQNLTIPFSNVTKDYKPNVTNLFSDSLDKFKDSNNTYNNDYNLNQRENNYRSNPKSSG